MTEDAISWGRPDNGEWINPLKLLSEVNTIIILQVNKLKHKRWVAQVTWWASGRARIQTHSFGLWTTTLKN